MRKGNRIYAIIAVLLLSLGACSLIHDDMEELGYREDGSAYAYVSLTIHTGTAGNVTRANPTGGETGDGYEDGQTYENAVSNLTLFFYPATLGDDGVNRNGDVDFTACVYIQNPDPNWEVSDGTELIDKTFKVGPVKVNGLKTNQQYHVLAVANAGNQTGISSLDALREAQINQVYAFSKQEGYSNFVMASEGDEDPVLDIKYDNSKDNPATTSIDLERLVARVDYQAEGEYKTTTNDANDIEGTVTIESAVLVNDFIGDTYFLKRTGSTVDASDVTYLGDETLNPANWVVDAFLTSEKKNELYRNYFTSFTSQPNWESLLKKGDPIEDSAGQTWYRIGYTMENTNQVQSESDLENYCTGIVFKAKFVPTNLVGYTEGTTFYRYNNTLYKSISDLQSLIPNLTEENCDEYGVDVYKDGYCYYTWWIKHNNDDNEAAFGPMEYAIVRNNIYQLKVTSIAGLGEKEPGKSGNIVVIVAIQKWSKLEGEDLTFTED